MSKVIFAIEVQGYSSGQTDFSERLSTIDPDVKAPLAKFISGIYNVINDTTGTKFISITTVGHSDRQDLPGLTSEQRREDELKASSSRASSATAWLLSKINVMQDGGEPKTDDLLTANGVAYVEIPSGAAYLINKSPGNDESLRAQNRRVTFNVIAINVDILNDFNQDTVIQ